MKTASYCSNPFASPREAGAFTRADLMMAGVTSTDLSLAEHLVRTLKVKVPSVAGSKVVGRIM